MEVEWSLRNSPNNFLCDPVFRCPWNQGSQSLQTKSYYTLKLKWIYMPTEIQVACCFCTLGISKLQMAKYSSRILSKGIFQRANNTIEHQTVYFHVVSLENTSSTKY